MQLQLAQSKLSELKEQIVMLQGEKQSLLNQIELMQSNHELDNEKLTKMQEELQQYAILTEELRQEMAQKQDDTQATKINMLTINLDQMAIALKDQEGENERLTQELNNLHEYIQAQGLSKPEHPEHQDQEVQSEKLVSKQQNTQTHADERNIQQSQKIADLSQEKGVLEENISFYKSQVLDLHQELESSQKQLQRLESQISDLQSENQKLSNALQSKMPKDDYIQLIEDTNQQLQQKQVEKDLQIDTLQNENQQLQQRLEQGDIEVQKQILLKDEQIMQLQSEVDINKAKIRKLEQQAVDQGLVLSLQDQLQKAEMSKVQLTNKLTQSQQEVEALKKSA